MPSAIAVEKSKNAKTGEVSATYASQSSCPRSCPLMGAGCYAESGPCNMTTQRLNRSPVQSPIEVALEEAAAIRTLSGKRPLRVHVVGDCRTNEAAIHVSRAMADYPNASWTYTHAWRDVDVESWNGQHVTASCETFEAVEEAYAKGYKSTAIVLAEPDSRAIMCPQQTKGVQCVDCKLCWTEHAKRPIGFIVHGAGAKKAREAIK